MSEPHTTWAIRSTFANPFKIQRRFIYLDPDYAGKDTARYPWLKSS